MKDLQLHLDKIQLDVHAWVKRIFKTKNKVSTGFDIFTNSQLSSDIKNLVIMGQLDIIKQVRLANQLSETLIKEQKYDKSVYDAEAKKGYLLAIKNINKVLDELTKAVKKK